eukprot:TRINITY_DN4180_c0_g2_i1.p1 TRINITY_DN4180_c0_g2~~TRINITY_DN4180_c0_g2_i1.p1  ORF type:complete len:422 (+),score=90.48 TRINITY_DN4180_c0_g2_i1:65-1330(+)
MCIRDRGEVEPWMDDQYLMSLFTNAKPASVKVIRDKSTGLNAGYAFIDFENHDVAQLVLSTYNGRDIPGTSGKKFRLNWGVPGGNTKSMSFAQGNNAVKETTLKPVLPGSPEYSIYVGDLDPRVSELELIDIFSKKYKSVIGAKIIVDPITKVSKGYGFVKFSNFDDSERAINDFSGYLIRGRPLKANHSNMKTPNEIASLLNIYGSNMMNNPMHLMMGMTPTGTHTRPGPGSSATPLDYMAAFQQMSMMMPGLIPQDGSGNIDFASAYAAMVQNFMTQASGMPSMGNTVSQPAQPYPPAAMPNPYAAYYQQAYGQYYPTPGATGVPAQNPYAAAPGYPQTAVQAPQQQAFAQQDQQKVPAQQSTEMKDERQTSQYQIPKQDTRMLIEEISELNEDYMGQSSGWSALVFTSSIRESLYNEH